MIYVILGEASTESEGVEGQGKEFGEMEVKLNEETKENVSMIEHPFTFYMLVFAVKSIENLLYTV